MRALWICISLIIAGAALYFVMNRFAEPSSSIEVSRPPVTQNANSKEVQTAAGMCPWRTPDEDRRKWFPGSISSRDEILVLSRHRVELQRRLGRRPGSDDGAVIVHRILGAGRSPGVVVTRRVRGESGLIELVIATDPNGRVVGARVQRQREPGTTAKTLQSKSWLDAFRGKDSGSHWKLGEDIPDVPTSARPSVRSVIAEARNVLILLDVGLHSDASLPPDAHSEEHGHAI